MQTPNEQSDDPQELMRLAKQGSSAAFGTLYNRYFTPIYRYIYVRVRSRQEAEDLTQTVFMKVLSAIDQYRDIGKEPLAYFFRVARNAVFDLTKKKKPVLLDDPAVAERHLAVEGVDVLALDQQQDRARLLKFMEHLTAEQQEVLSLKFFGERSNREIAEALGKSEEAVRQLQSRAIKGLREQYHAYGTE